MKNKLNIFLIIGIFFNITKADVNIAKIFEAERKYFKKNHKEVVSAIQDALKAFFEQYDNPSGNEEKVSSYLDFSMPKEINCYSFGSHNYKHEILLGFEYKNIKKLSKEEQAQLIEYAKNAMTHLLDREVFGTRAISPDFTLYFVIKTIEKITDK